MRIGLFIPAYNVEGTIGSVLEAIPPEALSALESIWVIDNGSRDATIERTLEFARKPAGAKVRVFQNERNYFLGGSTILALRMAKEQGLDFLICMHSDGQASPKELPRFIDRCKPEIGVVLGSRFLPESAVSEYSPLRKLGNLFFIALQKRILGRDVRDLGSFIAFNVREATGLPYGELPYDMGYQPLLLMLLLARKEVRHVEIPISWGAVESSNVNPVSYGLRHLGRLLRIAAGRIPRSGVGVDHFITNEKSK